MRAEDIPEIYGKNYLSKGSHVSHPWELVEFASAWLHVFATPEDAMEFAFENGIWVDWIDSEVLRDS